MELTSLFDLLRQHGLYPTRSLGQVFLQDEKLMDAILVLLSPGPGDSVVEIGAGPGLITQKLAQLADSVLAIEIDPKFEALHKQVFSSLDRPPKVIYEDARKLDYGELIPADGGRLLVFGNLPYYLTTDLILTALAGMPRMSLALFMVQADVRERLTAKPGSKAYGTLSVVSQLFGQWRFERTVSRKAFYPQPKVTSALLTLIPSDHEEDRMIAADRAFHRFMIRLMQYRRKSLSNALKASAYGPDDEEGWQAFDFFLKRYGFTAGVRAEQLTPGQLAELYGLLF